MIYIEMKYETKVSDGITAAMTDFTSTIKATAVEAEAQPSRFIWNSSDGLGMAVEYSRIRCLRINKNEVSPINRVTVAAALMQRCPITPIPHVDTFHVRLMQDYYVPAHFISYFSPGYSEDVKRGDDCSFVVSATENTRILKVFANSTILIADPGGSDRLKQYTIRNIQENIRIIIHYATIQQG